MQKKAMVAIARARINLMLHQDMESRISIRDIDIQDISTIQPIETYINIAMTNRPVLSIILSATWIFFEWGKTKSDVKGLTHKRKAFMEKLKEIKNNVALEIKLNHENLIVSKKNIKTAQKALKQARENLRITQLQYKQQVASSSDILDASAFLTGADTNYYRAVYGYMTTLASLNRAIGN